MCTSHVEIVDGLGHIELVHGVDDDAGSREEGEQEEEEEVDHHIEHVPGKTPH